VPRNAGNAKKSGLYDKVVQWVMLKRTML